MLNHAKHSTQAGFAPSNVPKGERRAKFNEVVKALQGKGLSLATILGFIGTILNGVGAGNPVASIIAQILAILGNVAPTTPPAA